MKIRRSVESSYKNTTYDIHNDLIFSFWLVIDESFSDREYLTIGDLINKVTKRIFFNIDSLSFIDKYV